MAVQLCQHDLEIYDQQNDILKKYLSQRVEEITQKLKSRESQCQQLRSQIKSDLPSNDEISQSIYLKQKYQLESEQLLNQARQKREQLQLLLQSAELELQKEKNTPIIKQTDTLKFLQQQHQNVELKLVEAQSMELDYQEILSKFATPQQQQQILLQKSNELAALDQKISQQQNQNQQIQKTVKQSINNLKLQNQHLVETQTKNQELLKHKQEQLRLMRLQQLESPIFEDFQYEKQPNPFFGIKNFQCKQILDQLGVTKDQLFNKRQAEVRRVLEQLSSRLLELQNEQNETKRQIEEFLMQTPHQMEQKVEKKNQLHLNFISQQLKLEIQRNLYNQMENNLLFCDEKLLIFKQTPDEVFDAFSFQQIQKEKQIEIQSEIQSKMQKDENKELKFASRRSTPRSRQSRQPTPSQYPSPEKKVEINPQPPTQIKQSLEDLASKITNKLKNLQEFIELENEFPQKSLQNCSNESFATTSFLNQKIWSEVEKLEDLEPTTISSSFLPKISVDPVEFEVFQPKSLVKAQSGYKQLRKELKSRGPMLQKEAK